MPQLSCQPATNGGALSRRAEGLLLKNVRPFIVPTYAEMMKPDLINRLNVGRVSRKASPCLRLAFVIGRLRDLASTA